MTRSSITCLHHLFLLMSHSLSVLDIQWYVDITSLLFTLVHNINLVWPILIIFAEHFMHQLIAISFKASESNWAWFTLCTHKNILTLSVFSIIRTESSSTRMIRSHHVIYCWFHLFIIILFQTDPLLVFSNESLLVSMMKMVIYLEEYNQFHCRLVCHDLLSSSTIHKNRLWCTQCVSSGGESYFPVGPFFLWLVITHSDGDRETLDSSY